VKVTLLFHFAYIAMNNNRPKCIYLVL